MRSGFHRYFVSHFLYAIYSPLITDLDGLLSQDHTHKEL